MFVAKSKRMIATPSASVGMSPAAIGTVRAPRCSIAWIAVRTTLVRVDAREVRLHQRLRGDRPRRHRRRELRTGFLQHVERRRLSG